MQITLAYGGTPLVLDVPPHVQLEAFLPSRVDHPAEYSSFDREFKNAKSSEFLGDSSPLIIVNDAYRHTPTALILNWLEKAHPGLLGRAHFLIATGSHKPPTEAHLQSIFGPHLQRVSQHPAWHDCTDLSSMAAMGKDAFGKDVYLNRNVLEHDRVLIIGSVEPHYFAGYTGGRKSLFPGLVDLATLERNHNLANSMDAAPLKLKGNPVAEHLQSMMQFVSPDKFLSVQLVIDASGEMAGIYVGGFDDSFERAVGKAHELYARPVEGEFDAVLCELRPPLSQNMYQAQKALENCQAAVADGGCAVVVAKCEEGIGSEFYFKQAHTWDADNNRPSDGVYHFGSHKLTRMVALQRRIDVFLYSSLPDETVEKVYYHPAGDLNKLINTKASRKCRFRMGVVYDAGNTVLKVVN